MVRHLLFLLLVALLALVIVGQVREAAQPGSTDLVSDTAAPADLTLRAGASEDPAARASSPPAPPPLDSFARQGVRTRLGAEVDRHYLDSLFAETDSIVRHWPAGLAAIRVTIVPGGADGFTEEMVSDVRWALDAWSPASVGLRWLEEPDSARADFIIRWADTLEADRAGVTDVTWDRGGRIRRALLVLATRSPSTGRPLPTESRRAVALHEVGHALGLPHSSRVADVMYPIATATELSDRDRFSLRLLYELPTGYIGAVGR